MPKGPVDAAMAFSLAVEALNTRARNKRKALAAAKAAQASNWPGRKKNAGSREPA